MTARVLVDAGVRRAYTVAGSAFLEFLDAIRFEPLMALVTARQDTGAAFMAEAEGKLREVPALLLGGPGPGIADFLVAVRSAYQDGTPMVVLVEERASVRLAAPGIQDGLAELDPLTLFGPFAKWTGRAGTAAQVPVLAAQAVRAAREGRRGPAVLAVPADFWVAPFHDVIPDPEPRPDDTGAALRSAHEVAALLADSRYPVLIAGGVGRAARKDLIAAADQLGLAVYTAFRRQDSFPENHARYAGHLGVGIPAGQLDALERADVVLAVGTRLDEVTTQNNRYPLPSQTLVVIGPGLPATHRRGLTFRIDCEVGSFLRQLVAVGVTRSRRSSAANAVTHTHMTPPRTSPDHPLVHPADVVRVLRKVAPEDTVVTADSDPTARFVHRYWCFTQPHTQLEPPEGVRGYAVPAALGAKLAAPRRTVVAVVSDAAAMMTGQELETAVRHRAPILAVVFQNGLFADLATHQAAKHGRLHGVSLTPVDFAAWARSFGAAGYTIESPEQLEPTFTRALQHQRPSVVDVRTDPDVIDPDTRLSALFQRPRKT
ncbi:thiamine pyrophosphate-dependent enzyme [Amycolatopsis granulosa]|uniref:thiamine pyrophosphate-dependent enzyme n=1 Tax=Amycolatopsis granulosa TaxID=185684 RepID=UPI0014233E35